ncbi:hypothetical protein Taro_018811 [Colocasia esculenta]|uniref:Cytochrome P450 n=2 Tax=Colocasia esculenta TaxID=4460 RepID=A0A843URQ4_COLES|nr:hypothetical protein [Colocasia esculenta]
MDILHYFSAVHPQALLATSTTLVFFLGFLIWLMGMGGRRSSLDLPIAGMLPSILLNLHRLHDWAAKELERRGCTTWVRGPWLSGMDFVATSDPLVAKYVSSTKSSNFQRGPRFREIVEPLGMGVITADSEEWRPRRKLMVDLLHRPEFVSSLRGMTQEMIKSRLLPRLADAAREKKPVDLQMVLRFSFDVMCSAILGVDFGSLSADLPHVPFMEAFGEVEDIIITRFVMPRSLWRLLAWLQIGPPQRLAEYTKFVDEFLYQTIAARKEQLQREDSEAPKPHGESAPGDASQRCNLLTMYLRSNREVADETGKLSPAGYSAEYIRDATLELLASGWRSTGVGMARVLWLLCMHPTEAAKIVDELGSNTSVAADGDTVAKQQEARGSHMTTFKADDLGSCVYLNAAIHESLRLYAPIPFTSRAAMQRDVLPTGEELPQGVTVLLPVFAVGRIRKLWGEDAAEFKPERWISDGKMKDESSYKFAVFGAGPRGCLGKKLSMGTIKAVTASVVYNFRFTPADGPGIGHHAHEEWIEGEPPEVAASRGILFGSFEKMTFHVHARQQ